MTHPTMPAMASFGRSKPGDGRIIHGDCTDVMKHFPTERIQLVVTDPPYAVRYRDRSGRTLANDTHTRWLEPAFREVFRVLSPDSFCVSFYGWHLADLFLGTWKRCGFTPIGNIVWAKRYDSGRRFLRYRHESAFVLAKGNPPIPSEPLPDVLPWRYTGNKLHPTQKSIEAIKPLIASFSKPGDLVLDPFMGSGTTLVAAHELGRRFLGIELDATYFQNACNRLQDLV
jgi:site-specific DNA-methyltransferase (adenine-specific)